MTFDAPQMRNPETLRFGYGETVLGLIAVATSQDGIVALFIGDDRAALRRDLKNAFPHAVFIFDQAGLVDIIAKAAALIDAPHQASDLVLDLRGSPLELAVWKALQAIPSGETRSYGALSRTLDGATAQEVGAACAANRIAVAVPCHRVVKADGSISGYRWGVARKRRLINMEGVA